MDIQLIKEKIVSFESLFLDSGLKEKVDKVNISNLDEIKKELIEAMNESNMFKANGKHTTVISSVKTPKRLQQVFYSYILAAEGNKVII